jgi:3-dehydroquinate synthase
MTKFFQYTTKTVEKSIISIGKDCKSFGRWLIKDLKIIPRKCLVITDNNVAQHWLNPVSKSLITAGFTVINYPFDRRSTTDESIKSLGSATKIYGQLLKNNFNRSDLIVALGGGVVGDLAGFCASTFHRGIPIVHYPTSFLAQVDSSIGGKTGLHYKSLTNLLGTYYQPKGIYIDPDTLKTLPKKEFFSGLAEVIKMALITDKNLALFLHQKANAIKNQNQKTLETLIHKTVLLKSSIISQDVNDEGKRLLLNFGHTIGHALETTLDHKGISHGEAVILGMILETNIGYSLKITKPEYIEFQNELIKKFEFKIKFSYYDKKIINKICNNILFDKKKQQNKFRFILPVSLGKGKIVELADLSKVRDFLRNKLSSWNDF